ncbi:MAG: hypothetical protein CFE43_18925 [Burkholderiales bacterium PBB3]|nr:MAG: hypothetical protein CFE43_18925 [Burkholderiales bacterium PBB3]
MFTPHMTNITVHVVAGAIGLLLGAVLLALAKGTRLHRQIGRIFVGFAGVVCVSALVGTVFFRFIPLFAVLTLLVSYLVLGGWRVIYTQDRGPGAWDAALTAGALIGTVLLVPVLLRADLGQGSSAPIIWSTLGAVGVVMVYDMAKWFFPRRWHARLWRYEHIYKVLSALSGMASAAIGNIFHTTVAQLLPSALGTAVIAWFFWREAQRRT